MTIYEKALEWAKLMRAEALKERNGNKDDLTEIWDTIIFTLERVVDIYENDPGTGGWSELKEYEAVTEAFKKQIPKPPIPDENATGIDGKPVPRCQVCGYALDLRMEQYCPCCGQRLTEYEEADT